LKQLLVYSYFCPETPHRAGGVQQIEGALLRTLTESEGWTVSVLHTGPCYATPTHFRFPEHSDIGQPDAVNPDILIEGARLMRTLAGDHDIVLSIDRLLPCPLPRPCVLMSNTLSYQTEAVAVQATQWARIIVPTAAFAKKVRALNPAVRVQVVPYGLPEELFREAMSTPPAVWGDNPSIVRLPHRPDRRKGHHEAIEGLARALPESQHVRLEISWLDEKRYASYRREIEYLAHQLGIAQQISFCGWLNGSERWRAMAESCAVLQVGCFEESFGLSIVESILFGRPAVTRRQPAVKEIVGPTKLLLEVADPLEWYRALSAYWTHQIRRDSEALDRHLITQLLSLERMAARYDCILTEAIQVL